MYLSLYLSSKNLSSGLHHHISYFGVYSVVYDRGSEFLYSLKDFEPNKKLNETDIYERYWSRHLRHKGKKDIDLDIRITII